MGGRATKAYAIARIVIDEKVLRHLRTLTFLSDEQLRRLAHSLNALRVKRRETIFYEGESSAHVYVLLSGVAKLSFLNRNERVLVGLIGPGEVFGVSSLLPGATRPFRCDTFSDCTLALAIRRRSSTSCSAFRWSASAVRSTLRSDAGGGCCNATRTSSG